MKKIGKVLAVILLVVSMTSCMSNESKDSKIFKKCDEGNYTGAIELLNEYYGEKSEDKAKFDEVSEKLDVIFLDLVDKHVRNSEFDQAVEIIKDAGGYMNAGAMRNSAEAIIMNRFEMIFDNKAFEDVVLKLEKLETTIEKDGLSYYKEMVFEDIINLMVENFMNEGSYDLALEIMNIYYDYMDEWDRETYDETILNAYFVSDDYMQLYFDMGYETASEEIYKDFPQKRFEALIAELLKDLYYFDQESYISIESVDMVYDDYSSQYATFYCYIKNNANLTLDMMELELIFYDSNGNFIEDHDVYSFETCVPGETFVEYTWVEVPYNLSRYEFKITDVSFE